MSERKVADWVLLCNGPGSWKRGKIHTMPEWLDLESDGILCLGYRNGRDGEHEHWPTSREALQADDTTVTSERLMQRLSRAEEE